MVGRGLAMRMLKVAAVAGDRARPPAPGVVVLIYHRVGGGAATEIDLPAEMFEEQMAWLAAGDRVVSLDRALEVLAGDVPGAGAAPGDGRTGSDGQAGGAGAPRPVVVTFDDGTADLAEVALPILVRHRVPATVYLATRHVDEGLGWPAGGRPLSWEGAREMVASGLVTVGSHTHGHVLLDRMAPGAAATELDRSRELIEDRLQVPADHLAYPKAVAPSPAVEELVRQRFRSAALGGNRPNPVGATDPHRLTRTAVQVSDGTTFFRRKADGGMALEDGARRAANRLRYRHATG